jgi:hypothetical protein
MSVVQASAHLPYVAIEATTAPLAGGRLVHLGFEEWKHLDNNFPFAERAYERSRPLFFQIDLDVGADGSLPDAIEKMVELTRRVYEAVVLVTAARVPSPVLSVAYHVDPASGAFMTTVGPFGREVLLYAGDERLVLDERELDGVRAWVPFLVEHGDVADLDEIAAGFATLERTSRPELTPLSSLAHEVGALEALLMPEARTQLTATFARRAAALLAQSDDELGPLQTRARRWYRARSEVLHGGGLGAAIDDAGVDEDELLFEARGGLVTALGVALGKLVARPGVGLEQLRGELDAAWEAHGGPAAPDGDSP